MDLGDMKSKDLGDLVSKGLVERGKQILVEQQNAGGMSQNAIAKEALEKLKDL